VASDKAYDTVDFVADCRKRGITPHAAMNTSDNCNSAIDRRTKHHAGYMAGLRIRNRNEECFG
jgi:hypothetical protein